MFRRKVKVRNKDREMDLEETKSYEMHSAKIWIIKHLTITGMVAFLAIVAVYIYVVAATKELNYLDALMTGLGSLFGALTTIFGT